MAEDGAMYLPAEILESICSLIYDTHKPSLVPLSLVNKQWSEISAAWYFRHVKLTVRGTRSLANDLTELSSILRRRNAFHGVHRITLTGILRKYKDDEEEPPLDQWKLDNFTYSELDEMYSFKDIAPTINVNSTVPVETDEMEPFWEPLVSLIQMTTRLRYLDYNCRNAVPMNVVKALEQYRPTCRLHVEYFRYRGLSYKTRIPKEKDLVQSPVLDSIRCQYVFRDSDGKDDYHSDAILRTIGGIIPNIRRVSLHLATAESSWALYESLGRAKPPWKGFESSLGPECPADLEYFEHNDYSLVEDTKSLGNAVCLTNLKHLVLNYSVSNAFLCYLTNEVKFTQLESLSFSVSKPPADVIELQTKEEVLRPASFLASLSPLASLCISGYITEEIVNVIFSQHGSRLRELSVRPNDMTYWRTGTFQESCLSLNEYRRLRDSCPQLVNLQIPVQRSKSKGREVQCYLALAGCKNLRNLSIELKCDRPNILNEYDDEGDDDDHEHDFMNSTNPDSDEIILSADGPYVVVFGNRQPRPVDVRDALMDCAMDENLASSIWSVISGRKRGCPLQSLKLYPVGPLNFGGSGCSGSLLERANNLCRAFLLERPPRDDAMPGDVLVRELTKRSREARTARSRKHDSMMYERHGTTDESSYEAQIFRHIWPERKEGSIDWRDDWSGIPLEVDEETIEH